jgi:deoxyribonuclease-4
LAAPDRDLYRRSVAALAHTVAGMDALGGMAAITHIGSAAGTSWPEARRRIGRALRTVLRDSGPTLVLLEGSAGGTIGGRFEELREILDAVGHPRLGVCLDTAHLFAAGWDLRTPGGVAATVSAFDRTVGVRRLRVLHLNDSKAALGSHLDRHENIGEGRIGRAGFRAVLADPVLGRLPGVLETPGFAATGPDRRNIQRLKALRAARPAAAV